MKKLLPLFTILALLFSCSNPEPVQNPASIDYTMKLKLISLPGSSVAPSFSRSAVKDMDWNEYYLIYPDNTFLRSREKDGKIIVETGSYKEGRTLNGAHSLTFRYKENTILSRNQYLKTNIETLTQNSDGLYKTECKACEVPYLEYKVVANAGF